MKKCEECIYLNTSICVYKCYKKDHFKKCPHNCRCCEYYGNCELKGQIIGQG